MNINQIFSVLKKHEIEIKQFGVNHLALFGSVVRNEQKSESDIDVLVEFDPKKGLFVFIDLKFYLEKLLGQKVDLVSKNALHPSLKEKILKEAKYAL